MLMRSRTVTPGRLREFSRMTIPTVPIEAVVAKRTLQCIDERETVRSAVDMMVRSGQEVLAVKSSRPHSDKDECVGLLTEYRLMVKVRLAAHSPRAADDTSFNQCDPNPSLT